MPSPGDREALEAEVRRLCESADFDAAVKRALRGYGPAIYRHLVALHDGEQDADDVFSLWSEDLWRGLPGFAWRSSLRTWCYVLARHASHRYRESPRTPCEPFSSGVLEIAAEVRSETGSFLDADKRDMLAEMRAKLPPKDRELLALRLDRDLSWKEVVIIMLGDEVAEDEQALRRESERLRKRFEIVRKRFIEQGRRAGTKGRKGT